MIASEHISTRDIALTNTPTECDFLIKEGYQNVHCVGARFLYLKPEKLPKRIEGSTLLVPTHSTRYANNYHTILDSISKFAEEKDYDKDLSVVCLSGHGFNEIILTQRSQQLTSITSCHFSEHGYS